MSVIDFQEHRIARDIRRSVSGMDAEWATTRAVRAALDYFRNECADVKKAINYGLSVANYIRDYG